MSKLARLLGFCLLCTCLLTPCSANAQQTSAPNSDTTYQQLKNITLSEAVEVKDLTLKRDAGSFHLLSGTVCFLSPVAGKITGAVFVGDGRFTLEPPLATERASLKLLTKDSAFVENFQQMVVRFTDGNYDEIKKNSGSSTHPCDGGLLQDNLQRCGSVCATTECRILQDVLSPRRPDSLWPSFMASTTATKWSSPSIRTERLRLPRKFTENLLMRCPWLLKKSN